VEDRKNLSGDITTQMAFMTLLADRAGHPLDLEKLKPEVFLTAMIASFKGDTASLKNQLMLFTEGAS
jgi:cell filamentation protein